MTTQTIESTKNGAAPKVDTIAMVIPLNQLHASPMNPRKTIGDVGELADAIKAKGLLVPLLVRPTPKAKTPFEVVFGERRFHALAKNGDHAARCEVRELTDDQALELMLIEFAQKQDLTALEEAEAFEQLRSKLKKTAQAIADDVKKSVPYVYKRLRLAALSPAAKAKLKSGDLLQGAAEWLSRLESHEAQDKLLPRMIRRVENEYEFSPATASQAKDEVQRAMCKLKDAPFDIAKSPFIIIGDVDAGACTVCPKNTAAQLTMLVETAEEERCTDAACWSAKVKVHGAAVLEEAKAKGKPIVKDSKIWQEHDPERLKFEAPFVDLADHVYVNGDRVAWKKVLKDAGAKIFTAVDNAGVAHELADKREAEGIKTKLEKAAAPSRSSAGSSGTKTSGTKRVVDEKANIEAASRRALHAAVAAKAEKASPTAILRIVAHSLAGRAIDDGVANLLERRGIGLGKGAITTFESIIEKADISKMQSIVAELLVADPYDTDDVCERLKIDVDAIEKAATDAFKATAKLDDAKAAPNAAKATEKKGGKKR